MKDVNRVTKKVIAFIESEIGGITKEDKSSIKQLIMFHFYEPSMLADTLAHEYEVSRAYLFNLL